MDDLRGLLAVGPWSGWIVGVTPRFASRVQGSDAAQVGGEKVVDDAELGRGFLDDTVLIREDGGVILVLLPSWFNRASGSRLSTALDRSNGHRCQQQEERFDEEDDSAGRFDDQADVNVNTAIS